MIKLLREQVRSLVRQHSVSEVLAAVARAADELEKESVHPETKRHYKKAAVAVSLAYETVQV